MTTKWEDIEPKDAVDIDLTKRLDITAPLNEIGERCPWPWDPQQLKGAPLGQYHCPYCLAMVVAGFPHLDYTNYEFECPVCRAVSHHPKDIEEGYCGRCRDWTGTKQQSDVGDGPSVPSTVPPPSWSDSV